MKWNRLNHTEEGVLQLTEAAQGLWLQRNIVLASKPPGVFVSQTHQTEEVDSTPFRPPGALASHCHQTLNDDSMPLKPPGILLPTLRPPPGLEDMQPMRPPPGLEGLEQPLGNTCQTGSQLLLQGRLVRHSAINWSCTEARPACCCEEETSSELTDCSLSDSERESMQSIQGGRHPSDCDRLEEE